LAVTALKDNVLSCEVVDIKTKKAKPLHLPEVKAAENAEGPVGHVITDWSKDRKWLLTTMYRDGCNKCDVYRVKRDGTEAKRIGTGLQGKFSPDGKKVLYLGWKDDETFDKGQLFVADMEGGNPQRVSQESNGKLTGGFCWSPDGTKIAYVWQRDRDADSQEWETFLMVMDADGKNSTVVLSEKLTSTDNYVPLLNPEWR
jgi:Tol biopolymer transport system component